ncbi:MAG: hypothetical protein J0I29_08580 [Rhizobiales bacterium]|nr:hypothetical protein [Hyphomicrobiales bacterium]
MESVCMALAAAYLGSGFQLASLDRSKVYSVPLAVALKLSPAQRAAAQNCAAKYGVQYRIVDKDGVETGIIER